MLIIMKLEVSYTFLDGLYEICLRDWEKVIKYAIHNGENAKMSEIANW